MDGVYQVIEQIKTYIENQEISELSFFLLGTLGLCFLIQIFFYIYYYCSVHRHAKKSYDGDVPHVIKRHPVSVIICAKNDSQNLRKYLGTVLNQTYPEYEVIVVNDGMTPETNDVIEEFQKKHKNLRSSFLPMDAKYMSRKKMCVNVGVKAARYDYCVFTDADCEPCSTEWLTEIMRNFTDSTDLVIGYSRPICTKTEEGTKEPQEEKGFFASLIRFDALFDALRYMGFAIHGSAYRGTIRNMAYRKQIYFNNNGYATNLNMDSGVDDIFVTEIATPKNVAVEVSSNSVVSYHREMSLKKFLYTIESGLEVFSRYRFSVRFRIGLEMVTRLLFYPLFIALLIYSLATGQELVAMITGTAVLIRYFVQCYTFNKGAKALGDKGFVFMFIPFEIILPMMSAYIMTIGRIGKKRNGLWKV